MRMRLFTLTALLWAMSIGYAGPIGRSKIDRSIRKEPAYRTKTPTYFLLAFGPEAKIPVWMVHDGDRLYVDRNGNGDLTEEGEWVKGEEKSQTKVAKEGRVVSSAWTFQAGEVREGKIVHGPLVVKINPGTIGNQLRNL